MLNWIVLNRPIYSKMDLALNNLQGLICHKTQTTNQPYIGPYQVLQFWVRVDLGVMAMKRYSASPKVPALLKPHHQIVLCHIRDTCWGWFLPLYRDAVGVFYSPRRLADQTWNPVDGYLHLTWWKCHQDRHESNYSFPFEE